MFKVFINQLNMDNNKIFWKAIGLYKKRTRLERSKIILKYCIIFYYYSMTLIITYYIY